MANNNLTKLSISSLRGVSLPLEIPFEKPMTLIYGENGSGKTSICDALDLIGNGTVGSIADVGLGGATHNYWPFLGKRHQDILVNLESNNGNNWIATVAGRNVNVQPEQDKPIVKVWRRAQLIKLILDKPASRFDIIRPFIDIAELERSEQQLRELLYTINQELNEAGIRIEQNLEILREQQVADGDTESNEVVWARAELAKSLGQIDQELTHFAEVEKRLVSILNTITTLEDITAKVESQIQEEDRLTDEYQQILNKVGEGSEDTLSILESSLPYFHKHPDIGSCPLCESSENVSGLGDKVENSLAGLRELQTAKSSKERATRLREASESSVSENEGKLEGQIESIKEYKQDNDEVLSGIDVLVDLFSYLEENETLSPDALTTIKTNIGDYRSQLSEIKGRRDALTVALRQYDENVVAQKSNEEQAPIVTKLLAIHEEERKAFVDDVLASIAGEVGRLYEEIHPGEGLNQIALQLDPRRRSSLNITASHLDQEVPPGAYFSNSHLDSLGLCILIALAKLESPENTILVMDDILGSVDEPHVDRMIKLLYAESSHFLQLVVTTHYHAWLLKIRRGQLRNADCGVVELRKWHPERGVAIQSSARPLLEILKNNIADHPNEVEPIAANAGHLLEQVGDFLTLHYECSVTRRKNGNTLNDYLDSLKPNLTNVLHVEIKNDDDTYRDVALKPLIDELKNIFQVRNITGAHYNELSNHLPPADVLRFGQLVVELCEAIICPDNGLPTKERNNQGIQYWTPRNTQTRRLYPFSKP